MNNECIACAKELTSTPDRLQYHRKRAKKSRPVASLVA